MSATTASRHAALQPWLQQIEDLYAQIETWAEERGWATLRDQKPLREAAFGDYEAPVLLIHTPQGRVLLEPIARFVTEADGLIDVNLYPSFDAYFSLVFRNGEWSFEERQGDRPRKKRPLTKRTLAQVVRQTVEPR